MSYFYIGAPFNTYRASSNLFSDLLSATGENTGNLLIGDAVRRHLNIKMPSKPLAQLKLLDPKQIEEENDAIVMGAANFLYEGFDFGPYSNFIEKIKLPIIIIGVGAQVPHYGAKIKVPEGTQRFMKIISERSRTLGARGYYSAYVLNDIGIKNVRAIGCPSMYWTGLPKMEIQRKDFKDIQRIIINGSSNVTAHAVDARAAQYVERFLISLSIRHGYPYILQNELDEMKILFSDPSVSDTKGLVQKLKDRHVHRRFGLPGMSDQAFTLYIRKCMKVFFNVEEWMNFVRDYDLVIGTRFHGTLIGLLVGIPSILLFHDMRTREMAEFLQIPRRDIRQVKKYDLRKVYDTADFAAYEIVYQYMYKNYIDFLNENNLKHTLLGEKACEKTL